MMDFDFLDNDSIVHIVDDAKWRNDILGIVNFLLKDITDLFLASKALPFSYRNSLPRFFNSPEKDYILCCNAIYAVIHQGKKIICNGMELYI